MTLTTGFVTPAMVIVEGYGVAAVALSLIVLLMVIAPELDPLVVVVRTFESVTSLPVPTI